MRHSPLTDARIMPVLGLAHIMRLAWSIGWEIVSSRRFILLLACAWIVAAGFGGLDMAYRYAEIEGILLPPQFSLSEDGGLAELFEYALTASTAIALARLYWRTRTLAFAVGALTFTWLTIDNAFTIHERAGALLAPLFPAWAEGAVRGQDYGELLFFAGVGTVVGALALASFRRDRGPAIVPAMLVLACLPLAAFFGVGVDFIHSSLSWISPAVSQIGAFLEDFGELAILCLAWALALSIRSRPSEHAIASEQPAAAAKPLGNNVNDAVTTSPNLPSTAPA